MLHNISAYAQKAFINFKTLSQSNSLENHLKDTKIYFSFSH